MKWVSLVLFTLGAYQGGERNYTKPLLYYTNLFFPDKAPVQCFTRHLIVVANLLVANPPIPKGFMTPITTSRFEVPLSQNNFATEHFSNENKTKR